MKDICCIGHITRDKIITPRKTVYMSGGTSFYFSYALNQLPKNVSFQLVTKAGEGAWPEIEKLNKAGIDVECFSSHHTVYFENKYGHDTNHRTQRVLAKADPFTLHEVMGLEAKVYHLGTLLADDFAPEVVAHLSKKGLISIDVQGYLREVRGEKVYATDWKEKEEILSMTHFLKVNEYEMEVVTGISDPHEAARWLAGKGVKEVIITLGSGGSLILADGNFHEIPAYEPREVVDATGCGDTYSAGYLYCRSLGKGYDESGRFAAAMCTLKLEHSGPFDRTIDDINAVIGKK